MNKTRKSNIAGNQISEVRTFQLGGVDQKVLIEGKSSDLPILITLHGGPGSPIPFNVGARGLFPAFTDQCILVCWDQYGSGINNAVLPDDICIDRLVSMTADLIEALRNQFPRNRIYLFGMSWGSVLAAKVIRLQRQNLHGVLVYGQVLFDLMKSEDTIAAIIDSKAPLKVKEFVKSYRAASTRSAKMSMKMSGYVRKYTNGYMNSKESKAPLGSMIKGIFFSPDYRLADFLAIIQNGYTKNHRIMDELDQIDLRDELRQMSIPYHMIQGETDVVTSTKSVRNLVDAAGNPNLSYTIIPNAAHMPGAYGMQAILDEIAKLRSGITLPEKECIVMARS